MKIFGSLDKVSGVWVMVWLTIVNGSASGWFGYDQGLWSGINAGRYFNDIFPQNQIPATQGIIGSCFALGNFVGCVFTAFVGGRLGRKKTIFIGSTVSGAGVLLQACAYSLPQLIFGRVLNGLGNGMTSASYSLYQSECAQGHLRGRLVLAVSALNVGCYCLANWVTYATNFIDSDAQWRIPIALPLIFLIPIFTVLPWLPESPRWLLSVGCKDEAMVSLCRLLDLPSDSSEVLHEYDSISSAIAVEQETKLSFKDVILCRDSVGNLHRILLGCGLQFMQQFTGINALNYYLDGLLEDVIGLSAVTARLVAAINSTQFFIFATLGLLFIDRHGRRKMLMGGAAAQAFAYTGAGISIALISRAPYPLAILGTVFLFLYYSAFGLAWTSVNWVYSAEINSFGLRTSGTAAAVATNWMASFIVVQFTPSAIKSLNWGLFILFAGFNLCFVMISWLFYPETSNRTLEDLDEYFHDKTNQVICFKNPLATGSKRPQIYLDAEESRARLGAEMRSRVLNHDRKDLSEYIENVADTTRV